MSEGPTLVLASGSPRRREILSAAGYEFEVVPPEVDEAGRPGEPPGQLAVRLAAEKAREVAVRADPVCVVLGVDTVVAVDEMVLGKPDDRLEAVRMLLQLSGRSHTVWSGFALVGPDGEETGVEKTRVSMRIIDREEAERYAATGEPLDKAGAYAIQGEANRFITAVVGSRRNVMGLPFEALEPRLAARGILPAGTRRMRPDGE